MRIGNFDWFYNEILQLKDVSNVCCRNDRANEDARKRMKVIQLIKTLKINLTTIILSVLQIVLSSSLGAPGTLAAFQVVI